MTRPPMIAGRTMRRVICQRPVPRDSAAQLAQVGASREGDPCRRGRATEDRRRHDRRDRHRNVDAVAASWTGSGRRDEGDDRPERDAREDLGPEVAAWHRRRAGWRCAPSTGITRLVTSSATSARSHEPGEYTARAWTIGPLHLDQAPPNSKS